MSAPEVIPGDKVLYVADICHARECDANGEPVFEFVHAKNGPMRMTPDGNSWPSALAGQKADLGKVGEFSHRDQDTHHITTMGGHVIKPTRPVKAWSAVVVSVGTDGKCDLEIQHPHGHKLNYPAVPYSAVAALHSWYLLEGA